MPAKYFFRIILLTGFLLFASLLQAGNIITRQGNNAVTYSSVPFSSLDIKMDLCKLDLGEVQTRLGLFTELFTEGFGAGNIEGEPKLPVYHKLIQVPLDAGYDISITYSHFSEFRLSDYGAFHALIPVQAPLSKHISDPGQAPFVINQSSYRLNKFTDAPLVKVSYVGIMRAVALARLDISAVQYNPFTGIIRVYDRIEARIAFTHPNILSTKKLLDKYSSPWYQALYSRMPNYTKSADSLITSGPATYVIVSDSSFKSSLKRFINWKTRKGFKVIAAYTDDPSVGTSTLSIKTYLQGLYNNPPPGFNPPGFVLFVGDVDKIPAWNTGGHPSDMYYCDYTNDNIPELTYGRFAAQDTIQLNAYIDKTLEYEQYTMPSDDFLGEAVMVAGADPNYGPLYGDGQINYGTNNYFNTAHGILSHTYLQPELVPGSYAPAIHTNVSDGVAYANYTAHGSENGWANPSFGISDIQLLQNAHKYCLMVGNCCKTANFSVDCFAKEISRAANKGALGYIGCSDYSYWDEDYWWACGFKAVSTNPAYDSAHLGSYDKTFHDHGEPLKDYFVTMGQMVQAGDYAVEESGSSIKLYYWETYCLMGDPSVCVYYSVPPAIQAGFPNMVPENTTSLSVSTEPLAYVALSLNDSTLLDARSVDSSGIAVLNFNAVPSSCYARLIITRQNRRPLTDSVYFHTPAVGISNSGPGSPLAVYPNPSAGKFSIDLNNTMGMALVSLYDIHGKLVISLNQQTPGIITVDGSKLEAGVYSCRIQSAARTETRKVVLCK